MPQAENDKGPEGGIGRIRHAVVANTEADSRRGVALVGHDIQFQFH